jgi:manganese/zinc/iron transport system permease protein
LWIIAAAILAALASGLIGTFLVVRKMAMLGDAISHAVLPGIAIAFLLSGSLHSLPMFIGAAVFGLLTAFLVEYLHRRWRVQEDASMGIVFTALFAIGVLLISYFSGQTDLDQECVLYGEIAYVPFDILYLGEREMGPRPVWILALVLLVNILFIVLLYKELKITSFDPALAVTLGINATVVHYLLMAAVSLTSVAAFESVGAILVVALLIIPGASAALWTHHLGNMLFIAAVNGVLAATLGYYLAAWTDTSIAGAITVVLGVLFLFSFLFGRRQGVINRWYSRYQMRQQTYRDHILLALQRRQRSLTLPELLRLTGDTAPSLRRALRALRSKKMIIRHQAAYSLTPEGAIEARHKLRAHRLWEQFMHELGLPEDHVHDPADMAEHFLDYETQKRLAASLNESRSDPHGRQIPPLTDEAENNN